MAAELSPVGPQRVPVARGLFAALGTALAFKLASDLAGAFQQPDGASFLFPPAAVMLAAGAAFGAWGVAGVGLGAALASTWGAASTAAGMLLFAALHAATTTVPAMTLRRSTGGAWARLWRCVWYGGVLANLLSAVGGTAALLALGFLATDRAAVARNLSFWWAADFLAALVLGLPLLVFLRPDAVLIPEEHAALFAWLRHRRAVGNTVALLVLAILPAVLLPRLGWGFPHWVAVAVAAPIALAALQGGIGPALLVNGVACTAYIAALASSPLATGASAPLRLREVLAPAYSSVGVFTGFAILGGWVASRNRRLLERLRAQQRQLRRDFEVAVASLAGAIEAKDPSTQGHVQRVAALAVRVGERLGMDPHELNLLYYGAVLHDVGKIGVPEHVLNKPGPLDAAEKAAMEQHVEIGLRIVRGVEELREVEPLIRYHQERWDGRREGVDYPGYFGLAGTQIPLGARILAVVDTFDAITHDRPYRAGRGADVAIEELRREAGRQFDPDVVDAFLAALVHDAWGGSALAPAAGAIPQVH